MILCRLAKNTYWKTQKSLPSQTIFKKFFILNKYIKQ